MKTVSKFYSQVANDSLYRNSIFLMLSTAVMALFGFFFWIINARLFSADQVGIATTLISVMTLISSFSLLGLGNGLIRFLPTSERKNNKINTAFTLVGLTSVLITLIYLLIIKTVSPSLLIIRENAVFAVLFVVFATFTSLANLVDSVFIAYRSSLYVLLKNTLFSIIKIALPIFLIGLGAYGIFASVGIATVVAFLLSIGFLVWKFNYLVKPIVDSDVVKRIFKFSLGNYVASFIGGLPVLVLPIIILNTLGAKFSAYFYMDMMIAGLLYVVPLSVSQSLFAEGSYSETELTQHVKKAIKIISLILVPGILATIFLGKYILLAFGKQYSSEGILLLQIFAVSGIFISFNSIFESILKIKHKIKELVVFSIMGALIILGLSHFLIYKELLGIGIAWITGQITISIIYLLYFKRLNRE